MYVHVLPFKKRKEIGEMLNICLDSDGQEGVPGKIGCLLKNKSFKSRQSLGKTLHHTNVWLKPPWLCDVSLHMYNPLKNM